MCIRDRLSDAIRVPVRPLIGCIATAPKDHVPKSTYEGEYGGNLDCNEMTAGATIILPVTIQGALLYFGDCKARMADGEVVISPEAGALITASVELRPGPARMRGPRVENAESLITIASATTLEEACRTKVASARLVDRVYGFLLRIEWQPALQFSL